MTTKKLVRPTFGRVLIKRAAPEEMSAGGNIFKPSQSIDKPSEGTIVAVGPYVFTSNDTDRNGAQTFSVGDFVLFGNYAGKEVEVNAGEMFVLLQQDEIEAVVYTVNVVDVEVAPLIAKEGRPA